MNRTPSPRIKAKRTPISMSPAREATESELSRTAASTVATSRPKSSLTPKARAATPPVKATWLRASAAKTWPRSTRKYPARPAASAIPVDASRALRMNSCSNMPFRTSKSGPGQASRQARCQVNDEPDRCDQESDRKVGEVRNCEAAPNDDQRERDRHDHRGPRPDHQLIGGSRGHHQQGKHQKRTRDQGCARDGKTENHQETDRQRPHGNSGGGRGRLVNGDVQQRPADDRQSEEREDRDRQHQQRLFTSDAEEGAEEDAVDPDEQAFVQAYEEKTEGEQEGLDRPDRGRLGVPITHGPASQYPDSEPRGSAQDSEPKQLWQPEQNRPRRAGESDDRQRVAGESLTADDHKVADETGQHRSGGSSQEGVLHELIREQLVEGVNHGRGTRSPQAAGRLRTACRRLCGAPRCGRCRARSISRS